jgi:lysozyme family protein
MISQYEGGYGWSPSDPGGPTNFGITCYDLAEYEGKPMNSMAEWAPLVQAMPLSVAENIYANKYATATCFNAMDAGKDCAVFDFDVNSGSTAIRVAQQIVGTDQDGIMGPITFAAIQARDPTQFIDDLCDERMAFLEGLSTWPVFGPGWTARVTDLRSYCKNLLVPASTRLLMKASLAFTLAHGKAYPE